MYTNSQRNLSFLNGFYPPFLTSWSPPFPTCLTSVALPSPLPSTIDIMGIGQGFPAFCPSAPIPPTTASFTIHFALSTFHSSAYFLLPILLPILRPSSSVFLVRGGKEEFFLICFAMLCFALCTSVYMMYTLRYRNALKPRPHQNKRFHHHTHLAFRSTYKAQSKRD